MFNFAGWFSNLNWEEEFTQQFLPWLINLAAALVIFVLGLLVLRLVNRWLNRSLVKFKVRPILADFISQTSRLVLFVLLVIWVLGQLGFDTTSLVALLAAGGLAVGLALKDSLPNFASGVMLILMQPFKEEDLVEVAGFSGQVEKVMLFSTVLKTFDNRQLVIPNSKIYAQPLTNFSANKLRRLDLQITLTAATDLAATKAEIFHLLAQQKLVLTNPAAQILLTELTNTQQTLHLLVWVETPNYWQLRFNLLEELRQSLNALSAKTLEDSKVYLGVKVEISPMNS
mgnify:CR=1 FL=1